MYIGTYLEVNFHTVQHVHVGTSALLLCCLLSLSLSLMHPPTDTIRCSGETRLEMQEFCHYNELFRDMCAPPAHLILENIAISPEGTENNPDYEPCICGFRRGFRDCIGCELYLQLSLSLSLSLSPPSLFYLIFMLPSCLHSGSTCWSEPSHRIALHLSFDPVSLYG